MVDNANRRVDGVDNLAATDGDMHVDICVDIIKQTSLVVNCDIMMLADNGTTRRPDLVISVQPNNNGKWNYADYYIHNAICEILC